MRKNKDNQMTKGGGNSIDILESDVYGPFCYKLYCSLWMDGELL